MGYGEIIEPQGVLCKRDVLKESEWVSCDKGSVVP